MRSVTYSMGVSLDGYIVGPDGTFNWTAPGDEVFSFVTDEIRKVGVHLLGTTAVRDDALLGDRRRGSVARRRDAQVGHAMEGAPQGGVLDDVVGGAGNAGLRPPAAWQRRSSACEPSPGR